MDDDAVADERVGQGRARADGAVAADPHVRPDDGVGAEHRTGADLGAGADDGAGIDAHPILQARLRMDMCTGEIPLAANSEPGRIASS
ncbi:hypothetical protein GCM10025880_50460 [Methylorubrum aminovorans]|nr:hypothetical protein GCM10025880_50460 [Methylorubrum aminovorans]